MPKKKPEKEIELIRSDEFLAMVERNSLIKVHFRDLVLSDVNPVRCWDYIVDDGYYVYHNEFSKLQYALLHYLKWSSQRIKELEAKLAIERGLSDLSDNDNGLAV